MGSFLYELGLRPPYPICLDSLETIKFIKEHSLSLARFGDGEFNLMFDAPCIFQKNDPKLSIELLEILKTKQENLLVGIPDIFKSLKAYTKPSRQYWRKYLINNRSRIYEIIDFEKPYVNSMVSRPSIKTTHSNAYIKKIMEGWKQIWQDRPVLRVKGEVDEIKYSSNLFDNASALNTIYTPSEDAYSSIDEIEDKVKGFDVKTTVILSVGPAATVLAYRLSMLGYQALDVGHLERAYVDFLFKMEN